MDVYKECPVIESGRFLLRQVAVSDWQALLKVYSDLKAVPIFNADNCLFGFYITKAEDMQNTIRFWLEEYGKRYYVRWSIIDTRTIEAIGTIELFHRTAEDFYNHVGLLRLDLRSDFETETDIREILQLLLPPAFSWFGVDRVATKIVPQAENRIRAAEKLGFTAGTEPLIGHGGTKYYDYWILDRSAIE